MTSRKTAVYGVGAALLVAYLASANMPTQDAPLPERAARPAPTGVDSLAVEVRAQASKLHTRMAHAPVPDSNPRNPFSFGLAPRAGHAAASSPTPGNAGMVHAAVAADTAAPVAIVPLPALTLMGIAEETTAGGPRRTAVIALRQAQGDPEQSRGVAGDDDVVYIVVEGQAVGTRYKVTKIGADAVELEDLLTHGYRRIAMR